MFSEPSGKNANCSSPLETLYQHAGTLLVYMTQGPTFFSKVRILENLLQVYKMFTKMFIKPLKKIDTF